MNSETKNQIKEAISSQDPEEIQLVLDGHGVDCSIRDDGRMLNVPGYGHLWWEPESWQGAEPGWVVSVPTPMGEHNDALADEELLEDLLDIIRNV